MRGSVITKITAVIKKEKKLYWPKSMSHFDRKDKKKKQNRAHVPMYSDPLFLGHICRDGKVKQKGGIRSKENGEHDIKE